MNIRKRILLVDFYNLYIRCFQVIPITNEDGDHFGGMFGFIRGLKSAIDIFKPSEVYVIADGPKSGLRRKMVEKDYKANRSIEFKRGVVRAYDFLNEQQYRDSFTMQLNRIYEYLDILPVKTLSVPYVEADDIIAEISNTTDSEVIIYSTDADFKQLVNDRVSCYNPMAKQLTDRKAFVEKFGFLPENFIYYKMIIGDKSDGLPGIKGIGPKTFIKLFPNAATEVIANTSDLIEYSEFVVSNPSSAISKSIRNKHRLLINSEELLRKNWSLMQLHEADISIQTKDLVREMMGRPTPPFNRIRLRMMFIEDKLQAQVKSFESWSRVFARLMGGFNRQPYKG